jgi:hypothetical protein
MRLTRGLMTGVLALGVTLAAALPAGAQAWTEYKNVEDGFSIAFPGQPAVSAITWKTQLGFELPARVYTAERAGGRFTVTVVDYRGIEAQAKERIKTCDPGSDTCLGSRLSGEAYWRHEVRGGIIDATQRFLKRDIELTHYQWNHMDLVEGSMLSFNNKADGSRTYAFIAMREMKLYIVEGTVPKNAVEPGLFQQSLGWVDADGNPIRYETIYSNQFHGLKQYPVPGNQRAATPARR